MFESGQKVLYQKDNSWKEGTVHGVKKAAVNGTEKVIGYLIDTGKDTRVDEYRIDRRHEEITKRINALIDKGVKDSEAVAEVMKHTDLPKSKIEIIKNRQPEQIEALPEDVKLA